MPRDLAFKAMNAVHRTILKVTGHRVGWSVQKMPVLELTTVGRKSGQRRTTFLTSPIQLGETFVVVASRGGDDHHPAWFLNLRDTPEVKVAVQGGAVRSMHARIADPAERARLWPKVVADHANYADYQTKTTREIPLVLLEPVSAAQPPKRAAEA
jgi:deazaflavin-dependent oxidoreductase (nitroreductase family)